MTEKTPLPAKGNDTKDGAAHAVTVNLIAALQALVSSDHPKLAQCHADAFKLLSRLSRAKSALAFAVAKQGRV